MENPETWTAATNVIAAAVRDHKLDTEAGVIGYSLPALIEHYLALFGYLHNDGLEVTGMKNIPRETLQGELPWRETV